MSDELYSDYILDEAQSRSHRGRIEFPTIAHAEKSRLCGDEVRLELLIEKKMIKEARFDGKGCAISQAAASILTREIEGKSLEELKAFEAPQMLDLLGVRVTPRRLQCGLLCFKILKTMIYTLDDQVESK